METDNDINEQTDTKDYMGMGRLRARTCNLTNIPHLVHVRVLDVPITRPRLNRTWPCRDLTVRHIKVDVGSTLAETLNVNHRTAAADVLHVGPSLLRKVATCPELGGHAVLDASAAGYPNVRLTIGK